MSQFAGHRPPIGCARGRPALHSGVHRTSGGHAAHLGTVLASDAGRQQAEDRRPYRHRPHRCFALGKLQIDSNNISYIYSVLVKSSTCVTEIRIITNTVGT